MNEHQRDPETCPHCGTRRTAPHAPLPWLATAASAFHCPNAACPLSVHPALTDADRHWIDRRLTALRQEVRDDFRAAAHRERELLAHVEALEQAIATHVTDQATLDAIGAKVAARTASLKASAHTLATAVDEAPKGEQP